MPGDMPPGTIAVMCNQCGARLFAAASSAGKQVKCPKCGATTEVPAITIVRVAAPTVQCAATPVARAVTAAPPSKPAALPKNTPPPVAPPAVRTKPVAETSASASKPTPAAKPAAPAAKTAAAPKAKSSHAPVGAEKAPRTAKPDAGAKHAHGTDGKHAHHHHAAAKPAPAQPAMTSMVKTQATKISQDTLAKFGKLKPAANGTPRSAADSWDSPEGPVRVWGQLRSAPKSPEEERAEAAKAAPGLVGRATALANRVPRRVLLAASVALAALLVFAVGYLAYAAFSAPPAGAGGVNADWTALDYTTRATAKGQEPSGNTGDTVVRVRVRFDVRFSNLWGVTGDDWEVSDATIPRRTFYNVSFSLTDPANRIGTVGFIVSGAWRPRDISIRVKREDAWVSLTAAKCKD